MMIFGMTVYEMLWYFIVYSVLGWVAEVIFQAAARGRIVNRGFLNGPVCPIYGSGILAVLALMHGMGTGAEESSPALIFVYGIVLATLVELIGGWLLDRLFHARWWDYSSKPFNFHGYICLQFSLIWGLAVVFVVRILQPAVARLSAAGIPEKIGWPLLIVFYALFAADLIVTVLIVNGFNRHIAELDEISAAMRSVSDRMSSKIGENTVQTAQKIGNARVQAELAKEDIRSAAGQLRNRAADAAYAYRGRAAGAAGELRRKAAGAAQEYKRRAFDAAAAATDMADNKIGALYDKKDETVAALQARRDAIYERVRRSRYFGYGRLLRAFPDMQHREYRERIAELRDKLHL